MKHLTRLPTPAARRLLLAIENVASGSARGTGVKKLKGRTESRRRIGHHRVIFEWRAEGTELVVLKIGPRGDVCK
jgi:mRNA-degrading endonuclease RelE of RelBE toxin-antitoxin system